MSKPLPTSITINEAVARMVRMDYIPDGYSLLEILDALSEKAEVEFDDAIIDELGVDVVKDCKNRFHVCRSRLKLAENIINDIQADLSDTNEGILEKSKDSLSETRLVPSSVAKWSSDRYGIELPEWETKRRENKLPLNISLSSSDTVSRHLDHPAKAQSTKSSNSFYVTFAFLVEALAEENDIFLKPSGPNVKKIADHLETLATDANGGLELENQGSEAIRKRITNALKSKEGELPEG